MYKTNIRIEVTQEHIDQGKKSDGRRCPIALAIKQSFPGRDIDVETHEIYGTDRYGNGIAIPMPLQAQAFVDHFDSSIDREWIKPFTLWLQVPEEFLPSPQSGATQVFFS